MAVTVLASLFIAFILLLALVGFRAAKKQTRPREELNTERCSVCKQKFSKSLLVERQIGDYKLLYFCIACITSLHNEMVSKN